MSAIGSILANDGALTALDSLRVSSGTTNTLESELSSGKSINSPADNPAGYITAQGFTSQINGITQALSNANQGISLLQTAQGAIGQETNIVQQLNSIAVQASNGTQTPAEAQSLQGVVTQLTSQVDSIAQQSQFNNINLLDGSFTGINFQVGANAGQTITFSIANAQANAIGMQASSLKSGGLYGAAGNQTSVYSASTGAFTGGALVVDGSNGQATVTVTAAESAADIASAVNSKTSSSNVEAEATNSVKFTVGSGNLSFTLSNGAPGATSNAVTISSSGNASDLVSAVNEQSSTTGITASLNGDGTVTFTQASGQNIVISNMTSGTLTDSYGNPTTGSSSAPTAALYQGVVQLQSDSSFGIDSSSAAVIGLNSASSLNSLASIDVSTTSGAQSAINVIKYALQGLGAEGGQLGAVQQRLQADVNNNSTTVQNLTSALSVVQDANIPQVSQQLTQQQVLQAAGIAALKNSTALQQMYAQLLP